MFGQNPKQAWVPYIIKIIRAKIGEKIEKEEEKEENFK